MIKEFHDKVLHKIVEKTNPYLGGIRRKIWSIDTDFTIISNNCWAGSVYRYFHLPYLTPTAGLYFYANDYIRFLSNIKYYLSLVPENIPLSESTHKQLMIKKGQGDVPIGRIDDVEIIFLHYPTFEEAKDKWMRRAARVNWENLIVKNAEMNGCTRQNVIAFDKLPYNKKFIFTTQDYGIKSQVIFKDYIGEDEVKDDTTRFNKYVQLNNLIKGLPFKK